MVLGPGRLAWGSTWVRPGAGQPPIALSQGPSPGRYMGTLGEGPSPTSTHGGVAHGCSLVVPTNLNTGRVGITFSCGGGVPPPLPSPRGGATVAL